MEASISFSVTKDGGRPVALARNAYDDFGRLRELRLGESREGTVRFGYNVRGWTTRVASPHFSQTLYYETSFGDSAPCWGGDISAIEWEAKEDLTALERVRQAYRFRYDGLDRLTSADYSSPVTPADGVAGTLEQTNGRDYSCAYAYDLNGNITSLRRNGVSEVVTVADRVMWTFGVIDDLTLSYSGNQLKKVADLADDLTYSGAMDFKDRADKAAEYAYDANGNMTRDYNKKIHSITYNILNQPCEVRFDDGHIIRYTYDAAGTKLKAEYLLSDVRLMDWDDAAVIAGDDAAAPASLQTGGTGLPVVGPGGDAGPMPPGSEVRVEPVTLMTVEYSGGHVYRNGRLERVDNPYGYWADSTFHYHITDYQGNIRAVIAGDGALEEVNNYYPYGGLMGAADTGVQPHKYGAKELDRENGLDLYDSHARWYDPQISRTTTQDPLAEKYRHLSPYAWCAGNPIKYIDPEGKKVELYATSLPGADLPLATHTFITIRDKQNKVYGYYAFGSEFDGIKGSFMGRLKQMAYDQDQMVYTGKDSEHIKAVIEITPPKGMTESEFDKVVESVAKSFGNNNGISYFWAPSSADMTKENCNTSTSTILLRSGVSQEQLKKIKEMIPGIAYGFSIISRPWTEHEQKEAVKRQQQANFLYDIVGKP